ncbi:MAG TPA: site-specific DNA-methyltransferase [Planctomycetaceae bacterium]|nr:site-specific DNA-methyltransferase [Blastopirellula sp.]HAY79524.1 site-specific DNA-methyltransferase [Planctomycetaceae bacterium]
MGTPFNTIIHGDCISEMQRLASGSVNLAFADPPFNIGYEYDVYDDVKEKADYLAWSREWIAAVHHALAPDGTFWLAIGDEYAAELKLLSEEVGFHTRSWVIWYYTFGVNCAKKFTRSHAHLFYFVKDPKNFTFRDGVEDGTRIPSARQLVYNDKRANPKGRLPDDTWIMRPADCVGELTPEDAWLLDLESPQDHDRTWTLRPQELADCFQPDESTWHFPRVAGTFKERAGFHGCQMPEQLLGRIIRSCSHEGDLVLDPFSGSATTPTVAKKLGRRFLAFELSESYVAHGLQRLQETCVGDRLDGSPEPTLSAPTTQTTRGKTLADGRRVSAATRSQAEREREFDAAQRELTMRGIMEAYRIAHAGHSVDRVVADADLNQAFAEACRRLGVVGNERVWNTLLFRLRKSGRLSEMVTHEATKISWSDCDSYWYASEIALQWMLDQDLADSLDEVLCCPQLAAQFDTVASEFAPGHTSLEYRWAALKLRKQAKVARSRGAVLVPPSRLGPKLSLDAIDFDGVPDRGGVYLLTEKKDTRLYAGETCNLRRRLQQQFGDPQQLEVWRGIAASIKLQTFCVEGLGTQSLAWQSCLVRKYKPRMNYQELGA